MFHEKSGILLDIMVFTTLLISRCSVCRISKGNISRVTLVRSCPCPIEQKDCVYVYMGDFVFPIQIPSITIDHFVKAVFVLISSTHKKLSRMKFVTFRLYPRKVNRVRLSLFNVLFVVHYLRNCTQPLRHTANVKQYYRVGISPSIHMLCFAYVVFILPYC